MGQHMAELEEESISTVLQYLLISQTERQYVSQSGWQPFIETYTFNIWFSSLLNVIFGFDDRVLVCQCQRSIVIFAKGMLAQGGIIKFASLERAAFLKYFAGVSVNCGLSNPS